MRMSPTPGEPGKRAPHLFSGYHFQVKPSFPEGDWAYFVLRGETCVASGLHCDSQERAIELAKSEIAKREAADERKVRK